MEVNVGGTLEVDPQTGQTSIKRTGKPESLGEFATTRQAYLRRLRDADARWPTATWVGTSAKNVQALGENFENLRPWVLQHAWDPRAGKAEFTRLTDQGTPSESATSALGYLAPVMDSDTGHPGFSINLYAGSSTPSLPAKAIFRIPSDMIDATWVKRLIAITVDQFDPDKAADIERARYLAGTLRPTGWLKYRAMNRGV